MKKLISMLLVVCMLTIGSVSVFAVDDRPPAGTYWYWMDDVDLYWANCKYWGSVADTTFGMQLVQWGPSTVQVDVQTDVLLGAWYCNTYVTVYYRDDMLTHGYYQVTYYDSGREYINTASSSYYSETVERPCCTAQGGLWVANCSVEVTTPVYNGMVQDSPDMEIWIEP